MKEFYQTEVKKYLPIIEDCFSTDKELLEKYHIEAPADLQTCVKRTYHDLKNALTLKMFVIDCITDDTDETIGFFGVETVGEVKFMTSFFIKPKYRNRDTFNYFWSCVYDETGNEFFTAIYERNARARKFLEKNGFNLVQILQLENNINGLLYQNN